MSESGLIGVFLALRPALTRYLALRGASPEEAEDVLQDVSLKLASERTGPVDQPRAYLYRMANNHFLLHRRTAGRRSRREEDWVDAHLGSVREIDEEPSAEARMIARQQVEMLQRAMDGLPERTRTIFQRFRLNGEPQRAIADDLQISVSAVEKHLARAYETVLSARRRFFDEDSKGARSLRDGRGLHER